MRPIPRVVRWLLRLAAGPTYPDVIADLEEEAAARASTESPAALRRWIRGQVARSIWPLAGRRLEMLLTTLKGMHMKAWRGFGSDLSVALRRMRDAPGFSLVCVITLALGIGGNAAVFTLIDRVLLKPCLPQAVMREVSRTLARPAPLSAPVHTVGHAEAAVRVRDEFGALPGLALTAEQARLVFDLDRDKCDRILGALVAEGFLARTPQGAYRHR